MLKGYRTLIFNGLSMIVLIAGVLVEYVGQIGLTPEQATFALIGLTLVNQLGNFWLRLITDTPVGRGP
ncbi:hypothetical protein [Roseicyclus sp.]|uniref:hypothetical protein n=1 Tax=Roseicyclus sp. TaxID=1914329 RepID=UPI003F6CBEE9